MLTAFVSSYLERYLSTQSGPASFFGNRSVVIHATNSTRLTCANFTLVAGNGTVHNNGTTPPKPAPSDPTFEGGAASNMVNTAVILAALAAFAL